MRKKRFSDLVFERKKFEISLFESLGLPKVVCRVCEFDGEDCVDPYSWFCGSYPFPVDPIDPYVMGRKRERVLVPACARCAGSLT